MEWWVAEAMELAQTRAPLLTDEHAHDLADDLYRAWPDHSPADAVAKFFEFMPVGWNADPFRQASSLNSSRIGTVRCA